MPTTNVTGTDFEKLVLKDGIVFVDFWAGWCGPCKLFAPIFESASEKYPEITFVKIDTDTEREISSAAGITSIPTLMAFRDGVLVFRQAGALPAPSFEELIKAVQNLDMKSVRAELAKEESGK